MAEVKFMARTSVIIEAIWLRRILQDLQQKIKAPIKIYYDNMSAIAMMKNLVFHSRMKHIEIRHNFIWELMEKEKIKLEFCKTREQLANIFTKPMPIKKFNKFRDMLEIYDFSRLRGSVKNK